MKFDPNYAIKIIADNWEGVRRCDLYRLFDSHAASNWQAIVDAIDRNRPDLSDCARRNLADVQDDWNQAGDIDDDEGAAVVGFKLANDPPAHTPQSFDNAERTAQRPLIEGLACLPGQLDLF